MMKYQEPEMVIIELGTVNIVTASDGTLYPSTDTDDDGKSQGGNGGASWNF